MPKRKSVGPSLRWSVFARDGFTCRYCGAQAGQEGVELHADHVLSVAEGGETTYDNLVTACQKCNGGKGARSMKEAPAAEDVIRRINERAKGLAEQANAIRVSLEAEKAREQAGINLKCAAYETDSVQMRQGEKHLITKMCQTYGPDLVLEWYQAAYRHDVEEDYAIQYVCGCARKYRERNGLGKA